MAWSCSKRVVLVSIFCLGSTVSALAGDLTVTVAGVNSAEGAVRAALYDRPEGFRHEENARAVLSVPARPGDVDLVFPDLPAGTYAVIAYHDENGDGKMDRFLGMIPTEGYALTNDPEVSGPPSFDSAAFVLEATGGRQVTHLKY